MHSSAELSPKPQESLPDYLRRVRGVLKLTQADVANKSGLHKQSVVKIEAGRTQRLNRKTRMGLARALSIPEAFLEALSKGLPLNELELAPAALTKLCPRCWEPGQEADFFWRHPEACYCYRCSTKLLSACPRCQAPIESLKFRFCPFCGQPYKEAVVQRIPAEDALSGGV